MTVTPHLSGNVAVPRRADLRVHDGLTYADLELSSTGAPRRPLFVIELDDLHDADPTTISRIAEAADNALPLVIGVLRRPPTMALAPVLAATTCTLTDLPDPNPFPQLVRVDDLEAGLDQLRRAVAHSPQAALACGQLLRRTGPPDTIGALADEAAVYSMLLGGNEFARWLAERGPARPARPRPSALVRVHRAADRLSIVLDHPERRNAFSVRMREELLDAMHVAAADPGITHIELGGAGTAFCSGGDLDEFGTATDPVSAYLVRLDRAPWRIMDRVRDRITARVHGACVGAGAEFATFADTVVAAPGTYFLLPEVRMGLVPGAGGTVSIPRRIGRWRAAWLMLTGHRLSATTALRWGLVDRIEEPGR
ncbi:enoyl-CoA hydratase/isomerase family protein [Nocardia canadensis]|uniref:enoyl-CoA hydratase/isomerase family protein n=1 Tax=Nocardia canadensis TaxID=3065238 RepID=UPI002931506A|nr:enoyl-CoA hydratase/isomerase family protein [Nocardia canadensis]